MVTALRPMPEEALGEWRAHAEAHYLAERIAAGDTPEYAAMRLAEEQVLARGGDRLGLNVFGPNTVARSLYDSLGYRVTATNMSKDLS